MFPQLKENSGSPQPPINLKNQNKLVDGNSPRKSSEKSTKKFREEIKKEELVDNGPVGFFRGGNLRNRVKVNTKNVIAAKKLMFQAEDEDLEKPDETKIEVQEATTNPVETDDFDTKFDELLKAKQKEPQKELKFNLP